MSKKNNTNLATQALLEMDEITAAIKEESKKSLNTLLSEAVKNAIRENCNEEEEEEYEVEDNEESANGNENENEVEATEDESLEIEDNDEVDDTETEEDLETDDEQDEEGNEDWDEFLKYQVSDNTYDLTNEKDYENVVKVYKLLKDDDLVVIRKDDDKIHIKDDSADTEYIIDLGDDSTSEESEEEFDSINEGVFDPGDEYDMIGGIKNLDNRFADRNYDDEEGPSDEDLLNIKMSDEFNDYDEDNIAGIESDIFESVMRKINKLTESKKSKTQMKKEDILFEVDLGITDSYQNEDPIAGLSSEETSKTGRSWDKGVPTGTKKPWAGNAKSKGTPFETTINEDELMGDEMPVDEQKNVGGFVQQNSVTPSYTSSSNGRKARNAHKEGGQVSGTADNRSTMAEVKALRKENKALKEAVIAIRKNLNEAYITNVNLGKITKLFLENTTSQTEKIDIVNRFSNEAKTIEQSNALYESIKRELNKPNGSQIVMNEAMSASNNTNAINETKIYKSNDLLKSIDLMNRIKNI